VEDMGRMVHAFLKGAVKMRECFCTASEAKLFALIIAAFEAIVAVLAHNASLDSYSLADYQVLDTRTNCSHDTGSFVTEN
jgi:hypothetical protein